MDWSTATPFGAIKQRLAWLGQRQQVLARNVANADTPGFVAHDLEPVRFGDVMRRQVAAVHLATTDPLHLAGQRNRPDQQFAERDDLDAGEASPSGNAVDLEEQMAKINETTIDYRLGTQLYRKYLGLIRMAASVKG